MSKSICSTHGRRWTCTEQEFQQRQHPNGDERRKEAETEPSDADSHAKMKVERGNRKAKHDEEDEEARYRTTVGFSKQTE